MRTAVGRTSPHQSKRLRAGKSWKLTTSNLAMYVRTEGTENHCVNSAVRTKSASLLGSKFNMGGTKWSWAPAAKVPKISKTDKSKCKGECPEVRSDGAMAKYRCAHSTKCVTLAWVMETPFCVPVDPDVKRI